MSDITPMFSPFDAIRRVRPDGSEYWSGRELMPLLGYEQWRRFEDAIDRAVAACLNAGGDTHDEFLQTIERVGAGNLGDQRRNDYSLSRYACYLVAMNGDPRKPEIACAQTYFAIKTREAELTKPRELTRLELIDLARDSELARIEAETRALLAEHQVTELAPAAHAWDTLASADGDYSVREAGYILNRDPAIKTGERRLFDLLRTWRLVDWRDIPYANHAQHVRLRPRSFTNRATGEEMPAKPQVRVTAAGIRYLHKRLGGTANVADLLAEPVPA